MISFYSGILVAVLGLRLVLLVTWGREALSPALEEQSYAVTNSSSEFGPSLRLLHLPGPYKHCVL